jgi:hypothetical protein
MIAELASLAASAKAAGELMLLVHKVKVNDAVAEKAAELNSHILSLVHEGLAILAENQALLNEKAELERKIVEIEDWRDEAAKYEKIKVAPGVTFYAPKAEIESTEPFHWICPNCYGNKRTSLIEREGTAHQALAVYRCFSCSLKVTLNGVFDIERPA